MTKKNIMEDFRITEISGVDRPAQAHAKMTIMKRHDELAVTLTKFAKSPDNRDECLTFSEILEYNEEQANKWKAQEALWPIMDAYRESTGKILADKQLSSAEQISMLESSTADFLVTIRSKFPEVEAELSKLYSSGANAGNRNIGKKENQMSGEAKTVADLEKMIGDMQKASETQTAQIAQLTLKASMSDVEKAHYETLSDDAKKAYAALSPTERVNKANIAKAERDAGDEVLKTADGHEIRKSVVGAASFVILKSQEERIAAQSAIIKAQGDAVAMAGFTKRAETELNHLPGTTLAKAEMLKSVDALPDVIKATLATALKSGNAAMEAAFTSVGKSGGEAAEGSPEAEVNKKVSELMKSDSSLTKQQATAKVYEQNPRLYDAQQASAN